MQLYGADVQQPLTVSTLLLGHQGLLGVHTTTYYVHLVGVCCVAGRVRHSIAVYRRSWHGRPDHLLLMVQPSLNTYRAYKDLVLLVNSSNRLTGVHVLVCGGTL